jgi:uncharacterized protein (DUF3084 family)
MKWILYFFAAVVSIQGSAQELFSVPADAEAFYTRAMPVINLKYKNLVKQTAIQVKGMDISADSIASILRGSGNTLNLGNADIDALVILVMMEANKSAQEDLKSVMMEMKRKNAEKKSIRQPEVNKQRQTVTDQNIVKNRNPSQITVDSNQLLQTRMDKIVNQRSKTNDVISSMMKKISDTQNQIIQNLK